MALGLLLGAATGAALIVFAGTRLPRREIRVTVTRDAVPRRSETLSQDAFVTSAAEPARGGPGDRRATDRNPYDRRPAASTPAAADGVVGAVAEGADEPVARPSDRTIVPTGPGKPHANPASAPVAPPPHAEPAPSAPRVPMFAPRPSRDERSRP